MVVALGHARRLEQILAVLGKYGLADWLPERSPDLVRGWFKSADGQQLDALSREARVRMVLTELGPTFIKLGQTISTRTDLIGPELAKELSRLQADVPADPPEVVRATIEREFDRPLGELFAEFDDEPLASASIAQVHRATLFGGRSVVVKVQHAEIEEKVTLDLEILGYLAGLAERHSDELRPYQPQALVADFRRLILRELDFSRERLNQERFRHNLEDDPSVRIAASFEELSTKRVLTMERIEGIPLSEPQRLAEAHIDTDELALRGANLYLDMVFRLGEYHADPHPGNIVVLPGGVVGLLDFGRVGRIDSQTRQLVEELIVAAIEGDAGQLTYTITRLCRVPPDLDADALRVRVSEFIADYLGVPLDRIDLTELLLQMVEIIRTHRLVLPSSISLLVKVLVQLEGTSRLIQVDFNLAQLLGPFYARTVASFWSPRRLALSLRSSYRDWTRLLGTLPRDLIEIAERIRSGSLDVNLKHRHLDTVVNRLVHGVLTSAFVLAASLLLSSAVPPTLFGLSILGLAAGVGAFALGARLFFAIRRSGGL